MASPAGLTRSLRRVGVGSSATRTTDTVGHSDVQHAGVGDGRRRGDERGHAPPDTGCPPRGLGAGNSAHRADRADTDNATHGTDQPESDVTELTQISTDEIGKSFSFWNVGGLYQNHPEIFAECINNDVTCLLETFIEEGDEQYLQLPPGFALVTCPALRNNPDAVRGSGGYGILYNCKTVKISASEFRNPSPGIFYGPVKFEDGSEIVLIAVYRTKNPKSAVFNKDFFDNLNDVLRSLAGKKVILGGDFNARLGDASGILGVTEDASHLIPHRAESPDADDPGAELLATLLGHDVCGVHDVSGGIVHNTFRNWTGNGGSLIDYVFITRQVLPEVRSFTSENVEIANHSKLTIRVGNSPRVSQGRAPIQAARTMRLFNLEKLKDLQHSNELVRLANSTAGHSVDSALEVLLDFVAEYTEEVQLRPDKSGKIPADTLRARREARRIERRIRKERNDEVRRKLKLLWGEKIQTWHALRDRDSARDISRARAMFYESLRNRNLHKAWKIARKKLPGKGGGINRPATDALSRESWEAHFSALFGQEGGIALRTPANGITDPILDQPFTSLEVSQALESKKNHRALGPDGFCIDHLRVLRYDDITCAALANFFNLCVEKADVPSGWDHAFLHVLYKGKGPMDDANNFRGITLKSQLLKMLESLMCARLRSWAETNNLLPDEQTAYRPGKMGSDHIFTLVVLCEKMRYRKKPLFASFLDLKKAFPSIPRQRLLDKLGRLGVSDKFLRVLTRLYSQDTFTLLLDGVESEQQFSVTAGVHEGSPLSPLLFILYISDLVSHLRRTGADIGGIELEDGTRIFCILYADDVLLISSTPEGMQRLLDDTCGYFVQEGMNVNPLKSEIVIFSTARSVPDIAFRVVDALKTPINEARYLGVMFERGMGWKSQLESAALRTRVAVGRCKTICSSLGLTNVNTILQIYDMFVSAIYRYSAGAWGPLAANLDKIDTVFCSFMASRYKLPHTTSHQGLLMQMGRRCAACDAYFLAAVQLARGLVAPSSTWGRVLASDIHDTTNRWVDNIRSRLTHMNMWEDVTLHPAQFLSERKLMAVHFSQWCHYNHLVFINGSSADLMRRSRPFGIMPAISSIPVPQARSMMAIMLSVWRWALERADEYPEYWEDCDNVVTSHHLLFACSKTRHLWLDFKARTGLDFIEDSIYRDGITSAIFSVFQGVANHVRSQGGP